MKNSKYFIRLLNDLKQIQEVPLDNLLMLHSSKKVKAEVSVKFLLAQFKYCLNHKIDNEGYIELRKLLSNFYTEDVIRNVEQCWAAQGGSNSGDKR